MIASFLDQGLGAARLGRGKKNPVGRVYKILFGAKDTDKLFDLVVIGREFFVGNWPVIPQAVLGAGLQIRR